MFSLLGHVLGAIALAMLTGCLILGLLIFLFIQLYPKSLSGALGKSIVCSSVLVVVLLVQLFLFYGALFMRNSVGVIQQKVETLYSASLSGELSKQELQESLDEIPLFSGYFEQIEKQGENFSKAIADMDIWLRNYTWRRVAWGAGMILVIGFIFCYFAEKEQRLNTSYRRNISYHSSRTVSRVKTKNHRRLR